MEKQLHNPLYGQTNQTEIPEQTRQTRQLVLRGVGIKAVEHNYDFISSTSSAHDRKENEHHYNRLTREKVPTGKSYEASLNVC